MPYAAAKRRRQSRFFTGVILRGERIGCYLFGNVFHSTREVIISATGVVPLKEMVECGDDILIPATRSYRKLLNLAVGRLTPDREDIAALAEHVRERSESRPMGAVAIVVGSNDSEQQLRLFDSLSFVERPLEIFRESQAAHAWPNKQRPPALPLWREKAEQ